MAKKTKEKSYKGDYVKLAKAMREKIALTVEDYEVPKTANLAQLGKALESLIKVEQLVNEEEGSTSAEKLQIEVVGVEEDD